MIKFNTDQALGKTITKMTAWSFGYEPLNDMWSLRFAAGGNKYSQLCAFKFTSALPNTEYPLFTIAFVAKLRSKIYHQANMNPSQWYIFKPISRERTDVLTKELLLNSYGFDIDKFFDSDVFNIMIKRFKSYIENGLKKQIPEFKKTLVDAKDVDLAEKFERSIQEAYKLLNSKRVNNKYYSLYIDPNHTVESDELNDKIEEELKKKGIYVDLNDSELLASEADKIQESSFDTYDWKAGSITGKGMIDIINDFAKAHSIENPIRIYDRNTRKTYNIIDMLIEKGDKGLVFHIDTTKDDVKDKL